jgi:hypothetical protein
MAKRFWSVNGGWNPGHWGGVKVGQSGRSKRQELIAGALEFHLKITR